MITKLDYLMFRNRMRERIPHFIARHLPKRIIYWCFITVMAHSTTGKYGWTNASELRGMEALKRFGEDHNL